MMCVCVCVCVCEYVCVCVCAQLWQNLFALLYNIKLTAYFDLTLFVLEAEALFKEKVSL